MNRSIGITRGLTTAALIGLMILAVLGFRAQEKDMESLREASLENIYWSASQSEAELARFVAVLGRYALGDSGVSEADVNKRWELYQKWAK